MDENLIFSLIIPVLNREHFLPNLFQSIEHIKGNNFEVVFVDNGSTDNSFSLLQNFAQANEKRFHTTVSICLKSGACAARNTGLETARGEYVYFFDSDDLLSPEIFSDAQRLMPFDLLVCKTNMLMPNGKVKLRFVPMPITPSAHILTGALSTQSMLIRKSFLIEIGGWNQALKRWNDYELGARLLLRNPNIQYIKSKPLHTIQIHKESITGNSFGKDTDALLNSLNNVFKAINKSNHITNAEKSRCIHALLAKHYILMCALWRENDRTAYHKTLSNADSLNPHTLKAEIIRIISIVWAKLRLPGLWRILYNFT